MTRTVDLVVVGPTIAALAAAVDALQRGLSVLFVCSGDARAGKRIRRQLRRAADPSAGQLTVMTGATLVCADGIDTVEAAVLRYTRTGRLHAVNTSAVWPSSSSAGPCLACDAER